MKIPTRKSKQWSWFFVAYAAIVFTALVLTQSILQSKLEVKSILAFSLIAVATALFSCLGGYLGAKNYFFSSSFGLVVGICHMLYIAVFNASPGWGDLTSVIGFLFFATIGILIGILLEIFLMIIKKTKQ